MEELLKMIATVRLKTGGFGKNRLVLAGFYRLIDGADVVHILPWPTGKRKEKNNPAVRRGIEKV